MSRESINWTFGEICTTIEGQPQPLELPPFKYPVGPAPSTKNVATPLKCFMLFSLAVMESIVNQT